MILKINRFSDPESKQPQIFKMFLTNEQIFRPALNRLYKIFLTILAQCLKLQPSISLDDSG